VIFLALLAAAACSAEESFVAGNQLRAVGPLDALWQGSASFKEIQKLQIESNGPVARTVANPTLMDSGTQIVPMSNWIPSSNTWYLFNREFSYGAPQPAK